MQHDETGRVQVCLVPAQDSSRLLLGADELRQALQGVADYEPGPREGRLESRVHHEGAELQTVQANRRHPPDLELRPAAVEVHI